MLPEGEYTVRYVDFPPSIPALTAKDASGHYNIYINSMLSVPQQKRALAHELKHATSEDFDTNKPLEMVEPYRCYTYFPVKSKPAPVKSASKKESDLVTPPQPQRIEITTVGQLLKFMVACDNRRQNAHPQVKKRVSIDIWDE